MKDKLVSIIFSFFLILVIFFSSFNLQIVQGAKLKNDAYSRFKTEYIDAQRGLIFDRNGVILAQNKSTFTLYIKPLEIKDADELKAIISEAGITDLDFVTKKYNEQKYSEKILIKKDFENPAFTTKYLADPQKYPGIFIQEEYQRVYPMKDLVSHLVGYTGETTEADKNKNYRENTEIGKAGVELSYDTILRGQDGKVSVDTQTLKTSNEEDPINGKNLYLTVDVNIQNQLTQILQKGIQDYGADGAVGILQNVQTGEILAYVSLPTFDNNLFVGGIDEKDYDKLINNPHTPLLDRVSGTTYPPGSVFKINTATALLETGSITKDTTFSTGGTWKYGNVTFRDFSNINQGTINEERALCVSSNIFHMRASLQMDDKTNGKAIDAINQYASMYGLGKETGIDVPEGDPGFISSPQVKRDLYDQDWVQGDLLNASIGQGYTLVSPIQIQTMVTTLADGGSVLQPRVVQSISNNSSSDRVYTSKTVRNSVNVSKSTFDVIKAGMYCGVHSGIIQDANSPYVSVSAKSGTAEFGAPDPATGAYPNRHGWAVGFFPSDQPKYAFTLLLEKGGTSGNTIKLARSFIDWLYRDYHIDQKNE